MSQAQAGLSYLFKINTIWTKLKQRNEEQWYSKQWLYSKVHSTYLSVLDKTTTDRQTSLGQSILPRMLKLRS